MHWRLLLTPPLAGARNMAIDEALLERARGRGEGVVRVYSWVQPTISFGRNQRAIGIYDPARANRANLHVVRRLTGGRALVHHREITYSVTAPVREGDDLRGSYARINALLVESLTRLGVDVIIAGRTDRLASPSAGPCFERPAEGELMHRGRKLVGSAQVRIDGAWLQHGSVLVHDDQSRLQEASSNGEFLLASAATLAEALQRDVTPDEFAAVLFDAVRSRWDAGATDLPLDSDVAGRAALLETRYTSAEWTWRA
jgi:lipoate-protein ligase A